MSLQTFLLSFKLGKNDPETVLKSVQEIIQNELLDLDKFDKISNLNDRDLLLILSSTKKAMHVNLRYYSSDNLVSINGETLDSFSNILMEKLKKNLNILLNNENSSESSKDLVESMPILKRNNLVPKFFQTSDLRFLEYDFDQVLVNEDSPYQNIKILHSPTFGNCLLLDDMQNLGETDLPYTHGLMNYNKVDYKDKEILILGGGDGGLLNELLKESPKFVTMIDIDQKVMFYCKKYLRGACGNVLDTFTGKNYEVIVGDCISHMKSYIKQKKTFDVIFNDLTDIPLSAKEQRNIFLENDQKLWEFVKQILDLSMQLLPKNGLYLNHAIGMNCKQSLEDYENIIQNLPNAKVEYSSHTRLVPSFLENWVFYQLKKIE